MKPFKKGDRDAIILLFAGALICILIFPFINELAGISNADEGKTDAYSRQKHRYYKYDAKEKQYYYVPEKQGELFPFDPNTADSTQFLRLGLRPWQVRNIYKYRAAGGRYRKPTDFARLYGLTLKQYKRLEPYIRIEKEVMAADVYGNIREEYPRHHYDYPVKLRKGEHININTADTAQLMTVPGIGSYYARQIVRKRARLGGFASPKQLLEIEGFPETALEYMEVGVGKQNGKSAFAASGHTDGDTKAKESSSNINANALANNSS
ncbi:MAG: helix-hairpin-helix domain-containing protein, partial [Prevotella sp.]|nr:helix-hairpin-helix domain-containing protein [Prevotella sp.]